MCPLIVEDRGVNPSVLDYVFLYFPHIYIFFSTRYIRPLKVCCSNSNAHHDSLTVQKGKILIFVIIHKKIKEKKGIL